MADEPQETPERGAPDPQPPKPDESPEETVAALRKALERANKEAETARTQLKAIKPLADKAQALEDASKSELEKLAEQLAAAKAEAAEAASERQRLQVAVEKAPPGASMDDVRWVAGRLQGASPEELAADAEDLFARFAQASPAPGTPPVNGRPVETLRPGALPTTPKPSLEDQIAAAEAAKDWTKSMALKSQLLQELRTQSPQ